jgi:DNA polymerase III subunit gamma/tau
MGLSLARTYRPKTLDDLVGQEALKRTLTAAIDNGRVASGYVLTGIRGVGKTTTARVIARALNCVNGPTPNPCGVCHSCLAIDTDSALDVVEVDAASENSVERMRALISGVGYAPMQAGAKKVYIIDEAHMLSKAAWNALLKTLEEPPPDVLFIFATTEARAIPVTVLSRCQVLPLTRISAKDISARLAWVAEQEQVPLDPAATRVIARAAEGSMRDALSLLDQAIATKPDGVDAETVLSMIGRAGRLAVSTLVERVIKGDIAGTVTTYTSMLGAGRDPVVLLEDTAEWIHQAQLGKLVPGYGEAMGMPEAEQERLTALGALASAGALQGCAHYLLEAIGQARQMPSPILAVEMAMVRAAAKFATLAAKTTA